MATTSITITKDAYNYLKSIKGDRSFSQTILSLKRNSRNLLDYAGSLKNIKTESNKLRGKMNNDWSNRR